MDEELSDDAIGLAQIIIDKIGFDELKKIYPDSSDPKMQLAADLQNVFGEYNFEVVPSSALVGVFDRLAIVEATNNGISINEGVDSASQFIADSMFSNGYIFENGNQVWNGIRNIEQRANPSPFEAPVLENMPFEGNYLSVAITLEEKIGVEALKGVYKTSNPSESLAVDLEAFFKYGKEPSKEFTEVIREVVKSETVPHTAMINSISRAENSLVYIMMGLGEDWDNTSASRLWDVTAQIGAEGTEPLMIKAAGQLLDAVKSTPPTVIPMPYSDEVITTNPAETIAALQQIYNVDNEQQLLEALAKDMGKFLYSDWQEVDNSRFQFAANYISRGIADAQGTEAIEVISNAIYSSVPNISDTEKGDIHSQVKFLVNPFDTLPGLWYLPEYGYVPKEELENVQLIAPDALNLATIIENKTSPEALKAIYPAGDRTSLEQLAVDLQKYFSDSDSVPSETLKRVFIRIADEEIKASGNAISQFEAIERVNAFLLDSSFNLSEIDSIVNAPYKFAHLADIVKMSVSEYNLEKVAEEISVEIEQNNPSVAKALATEFSNYLYSSDFAVVTDPSPRITWVLQQLAEHIREDDPSLSAEEARYDAKQFILEKIKENSPNLSRDEMLFIATKLDHITPDDATQIATQYANQYDCSSVTLCNPPQENSVNRSHVR